MCKIKSMLLLEDRVYCPANTEHHGKMIEALGLRDDKLKASFVKVEITPPNGDFFKPVEEWKYCVDQDNTPEWYIEEIDKKRAYEALAEWAKEHIFIAKNDFEISRNGYFYLKDCKNVKLYGNSTSKHWGNSTSEHYDNSTSKHYDNSTSDHYDNSTSEHYDNSTSIIPKYSSAKSEQLVLFHNSTLKDCNTRTIYQSGDWKFVVVKSEK